MDDLQSAWLLPLFCASTRANYLSATCNRNSCSSSQRHDARIWQQLCKITEIDEGTVFATSRQVASLPLSIGRVGIEKRPTDVSGSALGQLGRRSRHDPKPSPNHCGDHCACFGGWITGPSHHCRGWLLCCRVLDLYNPSKMSSCGIFVIDSESVVISKNNSEQGRCSFRQNHGFQ